mgnify:CR=1 FL=1
MCEKCGAGGRCGICNAHGYAVDVVVETPMYLQRRRIAQIDLVHHHSQGTAL